jgi:hypothetical protein
MSELVRAIETIENAPGLVASVRTWYDRVNGNSYLAGDIVEVFTGRVLPLPFQYGRDSVAAAGGELLGSRLVIFETEVDTERGCRHGGLVSFNAPGVLRNSAAASFFGGRS